MKKLLISSLLFSTLLFPLPSHASYVSHVNYTEESLKYVDVLGGQTGGLTLALMDAKCRMLAQKIITTEDETKREYLKVNLEIEVDSLVDAIECMITKISAHNAEIEEAMLQAETGRDNLLLARQRERNKAQLAKNNEDLTQLPILIEELKDLLEDTEDL